jgi:uncharacterized membrane protein YdjX (TVP38/TMEM64 family)
LVVAAVGPVVGVAVLAASSEAWLPSLQAVGGATWFLALATLSIAFCLLPSHATSLVAGFVFGGPKGSLLAMLSVVAAAWLGFAVLRRCVGPRVLNAVAVSERSASVHRALLERGPWRAVSLIALLRLSPILPFAATNLLLASLGVRASVFLAASAVGLAPRVLGVAWVGAGLSELDWRAEGGTWLGVLAIVATLLAVWVVGRAARAALARAVG